MNYFNRLKGKAKEIYERRMLESVFSQYFKGLELMELNVAGGAGLDDKAETALVEIRAFVERGKQGAMEQGLTDYLGMWEECCLALDSIEFFMSSGDGLDSAMDGFRVLKHHFSKTWREMERKANELG